MYEFIVRTVNSKLINKFISENSYESSDVRNLNSLLESIRTKSKKQQSDIL